MEITMPHKEKASEMKHYAGKAVFSAAIGHALDGLDLMILSFALSGIIATFGVDNATAGSLTSITLAGAFLGGLVFGTLADKLGRIRVLTYSVICSASWRAWASAPSSAWAWPSPPRSPAPLTARRQLPPSAWASR